MPEATGTRFTTVIRVALLSLLAAAAWLILSFATASPGAHASDRSDPPKWGLLGYDSGESESPIRDILSAVTKPVAPAVETVLDVAKTPVATVVDLVDTTPVSTVVEGVTDTLTGVTDGVGQLVDNTPVGALVERVTDSLKDVTDTTTDGITDLVDGVVGVVDGVVGVVDGAVDNLVIDPATDVVHEALDEVDGVHATRSAFATTAYPASTATVSQATAQKGASGHLAPISQPFTPWNPNELIMTGSGSLTSANSAGGAASSCDLPRARNWSANNAALGDYSLDDDLPGSPTFDTDSTPD